MSKALINCMGVAILWGVFHSLFYLGFREEMILSDIVLTFSFSEIWFIPVYIIELSIRLLPFILFQVLFGTYIYKHFCSASIYYFSRCNNRVRWFLKESGKLYILSFCYPLMMVISGAIIASFTNHIIVDQPSFILLIYYVFIHSLWLFLTALLMNVIAIKLDSSYGFIIVVGLQMAFVVMLLLWENVWPLVDTPNVRSHAILLQFNPISHLILSWHNSPIEAINERINLLNIDFSLNTSVVVYLIISLLVMILGCFVVKKQEWITLTKER